MSGLRKQIFERIEKLAEEWPTDGIAACGDFSPSLRSAQRAYVKGLRMGGLAAANVAAPVTHQQGEERDESR